MNPIILKRLENATTYYELGKLWNLCDDALDTIEQMQKVIDLQAAALQEIRRTGVQIHSQYVPGSVNISSRTQHSVCSNCSKLQKIVNKAIKKVEKEMEGI